MYPSHTPFVRKNYEYGSMPRRSAINTTFVHDIIWSITREESNPNTVMSMIISIVYNKDDESGKKDASRTS
jgi:hypothetical protein